MGRLPLKGLSSWPCDADMFHDVRIRKLIKYQSGKAVTVYIYLLCLIYKNGYYIKWDKELPFVISETTGFDEAFINSVIDCCLVLGLFSKELYDSERVLSSKAIQVRYERLVDRRTVTINEYNLIDEFTRWNDEPTHRDNMLQSTIWLEQLSMRHKVPVETIKNYIYEFFQECEIHIRRHKDTPEAKQHFANWIKKKFDKIKKENELSEPKTKRATHKAVATEPSQFTSSF